MFNKKNTQWLVVWFDSQFKFTIYINKRIKQACAAEIKIKNLTKI